MKTRHQPILSAPVTPSGDQSRNNPIRFRWFTLALGGLLFTSILALSAPLAEAQCQQWDVSGQWTIRQGSFNIPVALTQNGQSVSGTAYHESQKDRLRRLVHGRVSGTIVGDRFEVEITWAGGGTGGWEKGTVGGGIYRGTVNQRGVIDGTTYDKTNPSSTATWTSDSSHGMKCADAAAVPPTSPTRPPGYKPIKSSGKARPATTTAGNAATIKADPEVLVLGPGQTEGTVTLTWDAGPNHSSSSAWLEESTRPGDSVARGATGTSQVTLKAGVQKAVFFLMVPGRETIAQVSVTVVSAAGSAGPNDTEDQQQKHKKKKKHKKKHRHHDDDDQDQGND